MSFINIDDDVTRYVAIHGLFDKIPGLSDKHQFELVRWRSRKIESSYDDVYLMR